jgi:GNAT superfamily N-acetyltransferase
MKIKQELKQNCATHKFIYVENDIEMGRAYLYVIFNDSADVVYGLLADVKVEEEYRSKGIGTKLVLQIIEEAKKQKCTWLFGTSRYSRPQVHKWYEKLGFKDHGKNFRMDF